MKKHETIDLTESRILVEKQSKELIDSIKDHCTKLNRFNLKHVDLLEHAISKGIFDERQLGYIGA